jgi:hypothetical protein
MGYLRNHAIIVTSENQYKIRDAHAAAVELELQVLGPSEEVVNRCASILICPDGSKEGWPESDRGDARRKAFIDWLESQRYDDKSSSLSWVEVAYDYSELPAKVVNSCYSIYEDN